MSKTPPIASGKMPIIGTTLLGLSVAIDPKRLLVGRLLVQANSGGGKSRTLRRLLEQTHGIYQQIVIDPEGEFSTLREKYDYVLFGPNGDYPIGDIKNAPLLARRLLELRVSAIIDIYDLGISQALWVKEFLGALVHSPKTLWHPVSIVLDESHKFCPERGEGEAVSTGAVLDLMTLGRKRGFSGWLATQRVAKLHKSAAAECNNKLIGRTGQDDIVRAAKELGLKGDDAMSLRRLHPGQFYAYGSAICDDVTLVQVGPVETTHPESGELTPLPPPPRSEIRKVLSQFADLPKEAQAEARTTDELKVRVRELEAEVRTARAGVDPKVEQHIRAQLNAEVADLRKQLMVSVAERDDVIMSHHKWHDMIRSELRYMVERIGSPQTRRSEMSSRETPKVAELAGSRPRSSGRLVNVDARDVTAGETAPTGAGVRQGMKPAMQRLVDVIALLERMNIEPSTDAFAAWYGSANSPGFRNYISWLRTNEMLEGLVLTPKGRLLANRIEIPDKQALRDRILKPLPSTLRQPMVVILDRGEVDADELAQACGFPRATAGFKNYISALRTRGLATDGWPVKPSKVFFLEGVR